MRLAIVYMENGEEKVLPGARYVLSENENVKYGVKDLETGKMIVECKNSLISINDEHILCCGEYNYLYDAKTGDFLSGKNEVKVYFNGKTKRNEGVYSINNIVYDRYGKLVDLNEKNLSVVDNSLVVGCILDGMIAVHNNKDKMERSLYDVELDRLVKNEKLEKLFPLGLKLGDGSFAIKMDSYSDNCRVIEILRNGKEYMYDTKDFSLISFVDENPEYIKDVAESVDAFDSFIGSYTKELIETKNSQVNEVYNRLEALQKSLSKKADPTENRLILEQAKKEAEEKLKQINEEYLSKAKLVTQAIKKNAEFRKQVEQKNIERKENAAIYNEFDELMDGLQSDVRESQEKLDAIDGLISNMDSGEEYLKGIEDVLLKDLSEKGTSGKNNSVKGE